MEHRRVSKTRGYRNVPLEQDDGLSSPASKSSSSSLSSSSSPGKTVKIKSPGLQSSMNNSLTLRDRNNNEFEDESDLNHSSRLDSTNNNNTINSSDQVISIDDAIERLGAGRFQSRLLISAGLCFSADAMQVILLTFLTPIVQEEWNLSNEAMESLTSAVFAGAMVGTLILGPLADRKGRRLVFLLSAAIISVFGIGMALSTNYFMLATMVFFVGVGVGGLTVPFDTLAEFLPSSGRGTKLLMIEYFWTLGCLFVVAMAYLTLRGGSSPHWRLFVALNSLPCLIALIVGYFLVPESARWLVSQGRREEAIKILREAAAINGHDIAFVFPPEMQLLEEEQVKEASFTDLFTPQWRAITLRLWGVWGAFAFGYYGTIMVTTRVFERASVPKSGTSLSGLDGSAEDAPDFDYSAIFLSSSAELVGTTLVVLAVDRVGRIALQAVSYAFAGIFVCTLCVLAQLQFPRLLLVILGFGARVFEMASTCVTWVSTAEILTTEVRSTGHSTANAMARIGAFFAPFVVEGKSISLTHVGIIMLLVHFFVVICVSKLPETRGKSMGATCDVGEESNVLHDDDDLPGGGDGGYRPHEPEEGLAPSSDDENRIRSLD